MKVPLDDPIWPRLYGPYGVQNVNENLAKLNADWDTELANNLYWEKLHHQDDVYPVTFAALPWLWDMKPESNAKLIDLYCFISDVVFCANCYVPPSNFPTIPKGKFRGLSLEIPHHAHSWLPSAQHLRPKDRDTLLALETWFENNCENMANTTLNATAHVDGMTAVHLCSGFLELRKAENVALAIGLWQKGEEMSEILKEATPTENEIIHTCALLGLLKDTDATLTNFLNNWISETDITFSDQPDQLTLM
jgi:hypothetical protein